MKRRQYYKRTVKRHYGGELAGLAHSQLFSQRGLRGTTLGPANRGRRLDGPPSARRSNRKCGMRGSCEPRALGYPAAWRCNLA
jgi:hypothetical protein